MKEHACSVCGCSCLPRACIVPGCDARLDDICSVCHEEIAHDGLRVEVWTLDDCDRCRRTVEALQRLKRKVITRGLQRLRSGVEPDVDAMTALVLAHGVAPLVRIKGRFLEPREIDALIKTGALPEGAA